MAANKQISETQWDLFINWQGNGGNRNASPFTVVSGATHHFMSVKAPTLYGDESEIRLKFYLEPFTLPVGPQSNDDFDTLEGFSLWAEIIKGNHLKNLAIPVDASLTMANALDPPNPSAQQKDISSCVLVFNPNSGLNSKARCVDKRFAIMSVDCSDDYDLSAVLIKISIKASVLNFECPQQANLDSPVVQDVKNLYFAEDNNYPDINLMSKDNVLIPAHKFILAARSSHFRQLLKEKSEEIPEIRELAVDHNAKPLRVILRWMYTDEIVDNLDDIFEELLDAAKSLQLENLANALDRELIKLCNKNNMFEMITLAKKRKMTAACEAISKFIKLNLDSFVEDA